jgi:predicted DNA-binding transcriptional regulator AlpA
MSGQVIALDAHRREPEPLLTLRQLVDRFGFSERWWRYRLADGMPAHRWGGQWRFRASEVESWMEARHAAS